MLLRTWPSHGPRFCQATARMVYTYIFSTYCILYPLLKLVILAMALPSPFKGKTTVCASCKNFNRGYNLG
jgi:hypothetical protein